jgi:hypothetical protein
VISADSKSAYNTSRCIKMATGMDMRVTMMAPFFKKHEKDKKVLGMLQPGDVVTVLEVKMDKKGNMKIRHEQG